MKRLAWVTCLLWHGNSGNSFNSPNPSVCPLCESWPCKRLFKPLTVSLCRLPVSSMQSRPVRVADCSFSSSSSEQFPTRCHVCSPMQRGSARPWSSLLLSQLVPALAFVCSQLLGSCAICTTRLFASFHVAWVMEAPRGTEKELSVLLACFLLQTRHHGQSTDRRSCG